MSAYGLDQKMTLLACGGNKGVYTWYEFFKKKKFNPLMIMNRSAMEYNQKRASLSQELVRRLLNNHHEPPQSHRDDIVKKLIDKLNMAEYGEDKIR